MAVAFDAVGPSSAGATTTTSTLSWSHTVGSGTGRAIVAVVAVSSNNNYATGYTVTATCGGTAMTVIGGKTAHDDAAGGGFVQMFGLLNPGTGSQTISIAFTGLTSVTHIVGGSVSFTGAGAFGTPATAQGTSASSPSVALFTSSASNMVVDGLARGSGGTLTSSQTKRWQADGDTNNYAGNGASSTAAGTGSTVTMAYTPTSADGWAIIATEVQAANASVTPTSITSGAVVPSPSITYLTTATPTSITTGAVVPSPTITSLLLVSPSSITSVGAVPSPTAAYVVTVSPGSILSGAVVPPPGASLGPPLQMLAPDAILSAGSVPGDVGVIYLLQFVTPTSIGTAERDSTDHVVTGQPQITVFVPPITQRRVPIGLGGMSALMNFGLAVYRINGVWYENEHPSAQELDAADLYFPGGHINAVDDATAAILAAAGYTTSQVFI